MLSKKLLPIAKQESPTYIEDVFSTYLYTGNGSTQTITNETNLSSKGGLVWIKSRSAATNNVLYDTVRGATKELTTNTNAIEANASTGLTSFNTNGFSVGSRSTLNTNAATYVSWSFCKKPKFFDIVTYTGTDAVQTLNHSLGQKPGMILVRNIDYVNTFSVYHESLGATKYTVLATTAAAVTGSRWNNTEPTETTFTIGPGLISGGETYIAYLFAHDTTADGLIQCGSFSGTNRVNLGWEPQFLMVKRTDSTGNWFMLDTMRKLNADEANPLYANLTNAEASGWGYQIDSTGFQQNNTGSYIYMAIRRGPMKTPTDGTKVFSPLAVNAATGTQQTTSFPVDMQWAAVRAGDSANTTTSTRLLGVDTTGSMSSTYIVTSSTAAESTGTSASRTNTWWNTGFKVSSSYNSISTSFWNFQRAPGFFDVVCYTGTGSNSDVNHNLGVAPELIIVKSRSAATDWQVYSNALANTEYLVLNATAAKATGSTRWNSTTPTSSVFSIGTASEVNTSSAAYVAYLFASCSGVSKVGSYTGTGATQTISCGFTGGARFVLIKRTDSTGNWYVWDTARGMVSGTDPKLALNLTSAETNANWVYTTTGGFQIVTTDASVNANGGSYIYFAVA